MKNANSGWWVEALLNIMKNLCILTKFLKSEQSILCDIQLKSKNFNSMKKYSEIDDTLKTNKYKKILLILVI